MPLVSLKYIGAFPDGDKIIEISTPNGGGGSNNYHLSVNDFYWGQVLHRSNGWEVCLQKPKDEYNAGDLQPIIDLVASFI